MFHIIVWQDKLTPLEPLFAKTNRRKSTNLNTKHLPSIFQNRTFAIWTFNYRNLNPWHLFKMSTQRNQSKLGCTLGAQHNEYPTKIDIAHPGNKKSTLTITLERTRRVFSEGQTTPTAPPIGTLPLCDVNKNAYQANMPEDMKRAGGIFLRLSMVDGIFIASPPFISCLLLYLL